MPDLDLKRRYAALYKPSAKVPMVVDVPPLRFLMLDGHGPYGAASPRFTESVQALYTLAYQVKFAAKRLDLVYPVMPLEGLYWQIGADMGTAPSSPEETAWRLMILLPGEVDGDIVDATREKAIAKKGLPRLADVRVQTFSEGTCVQVMHLGPYADEPATVERLLSFATEKGLKPTGPHHEIYLSDPGRTAPEKMKTVLRYGVTRLA